MNDFTLFLGTFMSLFSVVNPINVTPIFLTLTENETAARRAVTVRKAAIYMFFILIGFFLAGTWILTFFGISIPGIRIAGGLMLGNMAFNMLNPDTRGRKISQDDVDEAMDKMDVSFTPLAMPLLSGPGSIATVIAWSAETSTFKGYLTVVAAIILVCVISYAVLRLAQVATKLMGKNGLGIMTRIMGFILLCVGIQFIINGITPLLKGL